MPARNPAATPSAPVPAPSAASTAAAVATRCTTRAVDTPAETCRQAAAVRIVWLHSSGSPAASISASTVHDPTAGTPASSRPAASSSGTDSADFHTWVARKSRGSDSGTALPRRVSPLSKPHAASEVSTSMIVSA